MHQGMVRCGYCLHPFDARPNFSPDHPDPQLELPILDGPIVKAEEPPDIEAADIPEISPSVSNTPADQMPDSSVPPVLNMDAAPAEAMPPMNTEFSLGEEARPEVETQASDSRSTKATVLHPMTLAEQVTIVQDGNDSVEQTERRIWPWAIASMLLLILLLMQAAYYFRTDLAARVPALKPALIEYCQLIGCDVALPHETDLISIESSGIEADQTDENLITLNALLRNRAPYTQAFPNLELTLNDSQDKPMARRIFRPSEYLPPLENEKNGLPPNHEFSIKLRLDTTSLKPSGYRLMLL